MFENYECFSHKSHNNDHLRENPSEKCQTKISKGILQHRINNHACHRSICLFARDCFTWITLHAQMLTGQWQDRHSALCISASVSPDSQELFSTLTKTKRTRNCSCCFYAVFHNSQNGIFNAHVWIPPSDRPGHGIFCPAGHSWVAPTSSLISPLIPGLTQCLPVGGISQAFFKIFVHL